MGIKTFLNNLRYLARYNLKEINNKITEFDDRFEFLKYELIEESEQTYRPNILNSIQTINYIIDKKISLSRFGDGEFQLIQGKDCIFQDVDINLQKRLKEILSSNMNNHCVAIPHGMCHMRSGNKKQKQFVRSFYVKNNDWIFNSIIKNKLYLNSDFTAILQEKEAYNLIRKIWNNRDVTIISGDRVFKGIQYNIFDCAKSIEYINAPTVNAFEKYDEILNQAKKIDKNRLVCIILGPTATVLAYDLAQEGYQALDLGHIVKAYDFYISSGNRTILSEEETKIFFDKD